jgi:hypothetical protein
MEQKRLSHSSNTDLFFILSIIIGILFKVFFITQMDFHVDELVMIQYQYEFESLSALLKRIKEQDTHMPLFFIFSHFTFQKFYHQEWVIRFIPMMISTLGMYIYYIKLKSIFDQKLAKVSTSLLFLSAPAIIITNSFRPYYLFFFLSILFLLSALEIIKDGINKKNVLFLFAWSLLVLYTHYYGILLVGITYLYLIFTIKINRYLIFSIPLLIMFLLPFSQDIIIDFFTKHTYRDFPSFFDLAKYVIHYFFGLVLFLFGFFVLLYYKVKFLSLLSTLSKDKVFIFSVLLVLFSFLIAFMKSYFITPSFKARYFIYLAPVISIGLYRVFEKISIPRNRNLLIITLVLIVLSNIKTLTNYSLMTERYHRLFSETIQKSIKGSRPLIFYEDIRYCPYSYYLRFAEKENFYCYTQWNFRKYKKLLEENKERELLFISKFKTYNNFHFSNRD